MSRWINYVTFFRNLITSLIFGLLVPHLLITRYDPNGLFFNYSAVMLNGLIFVGVYTAYGLFKKDTVIRFFIGCGWIATLVYFYTVGNSFFSMYLPNCGFGLFCADGDLQGTKIAFSFNYAWLVISLLSLKFLNMFRHLVKPMERKYEYFYFSKRFEERLNK